MPEVSDEVMELASLLAALAMLRVFLRLPGRHRPSSGAVPPAGQAADLRHLRRSSMTTPSSVWRRSPGRRT